MITVAELWAQQSNIFASLHRRQSDLARYAYTIRSLRLLDVSRDETYQRTFNGLYMVRRNVHWRSKFYSMLETCKAEPRPNFRTVLSQLFQDTGRVEASFASKLVATIDPGLPIYDSIVRQNLDLQQRAGRRSDRLELLATDYAFIQAHSSEQTQTGIFRRLRAEFDDQFAEFVEFSDTKVLDLMIWQMR